MTGKQTIQTATHELKPFIHTVESRRHSVPHRSTVNALVFAVLAGGTPSRLSHRKKTLQRAEDKGRALRTALPLLLHRNTHRSAPRALPVLSARRLSLVVDTLRGDDSAHRVQRKRRLALHRIPRARLPRRDLRTDDRALAVCQKDRTEHLACARQHRNSHSCHGVLHPHRQPYELRDNRQAH